MRILYFDQHFSTPAGSIGTHAFDRAKSLIARGHEVTVVCGRYRGAVSGLEGKFIKGERRGIIQGIDVIEIDCADANAMGIAERISMFLAYATHGIRLVFTEKYDLVLASASPLTAAVPGIIARWLRRKKLVIEIRDLWAAQAHAAGINSNPLWRNILRAITWVAYRSAHRLIALSPGVMRGMLRRGAKAKRTAMIPSGSDLSQFATAKRWRPETVADDTLLALYVGAHGVANDLDALLDAAAVLKLRGREDIRILLVGEGKRKPVHTERIRYEGLNNVQCHIPMDQKALAGLMLGADLGLQIMADTHAFYFGTSPDKYADYLAAGLPVLTNYPGQIAKMVTEHACGFVTMPQNPAALADALERAADDRQALKKMCKNAHALAIGEFDRHRLADQFAEWVESAAPSR